MGNNTSLGIHRNAIASSYADASAHSDAPQPPDRPPDGDLETEEALARLTSIPCGPEREELRKKIICAWAPAARRMAGRYRHTGETMDDLVQVATLGLIEAVDRFDPRRGVAFRHFATATVLGELKHHFRDRGWSVRVSRRVQELHHEIRQAEPELAQRLRRIPTVADLAAYLALSEDDVVAGRNVGSAYNARSLNWRASGEAAELGELLGHTDHEIDLVADRESLRAAMRLLPEGMKRVLALRFFDNLTQTQIANRTGVSQMHVSRLIKRALAILRRHMLAEPPEYRVEVVTR